MKLAFGQTHHDIMVPRLPILGTHAAVRPGIRRSRHEATAHVKDRVDQEKNDGGEDQSLFSRLATLEVSPKS